MIVETGTGISNANSYVTSDEAAAYFAALGNTDWYADEPSLVAASQAVDLLYGTQYSGSKLSATQGLLWPRTEFCDTDGFTRAEAVIPPELKKAVFELAERHLAGEDIVPNIDQDALLASHSVSLDVLSESKSYFAPMAKKDENRKAALHLRPILKNRTGSHKIVRG